ncbi:MAG: hypothetical protein N4A36_02835 [Candidatus Gracilibacteria bacterium]|jgi:chorismate mutase/prephenate dehydratase|nr:hypothetical protein [Candidatus Gracilibacteria bacterium]
MITKIGVQGDKGSTNERASFIFIEKHRIKNPEIIYLISTENVLKALKNGDIDYGTFAYRSTKGLIKETKEAIKRYEYKKIDEIKLDLDHALLSRKKINLNKTVNIYSYPQALGEHESFLRKHFKDVNLISELDTALSALKLRDNKYPENSMVIAPISCAKLYNLDVYMEDLPTNQGYITTLYLVKAD